MDDARIRPGELGDAAGILAVQAESWRTTYTGLLPQQMFPRADDPQRRRFWEEVLLRGDTATRVLARPDGTIEGFASAGPRRERHLPADGEVYALYLLAPAQGRGHGRALLAATAQVLAGRGAKRLGLWALAGNHAARGFYEHCGGRARRHRVSREGDATLREIAYVWDPIQRAWS